MRSFCLYSLVFFSALLVRAQDARDYQVQTVPEAVSSQLRSLNPDFLIYQPENGDQEEKLPLLIYLHGAGGIGDEIEKIRGQVGRMTQAMQQTRPQPCIVVAPQVLRLPKDHPHRTYQAHDLDLWLAHLKESVPAIDESRIYLTGNSMGGYGSFMWGGHSPQHFAAIAPIVGGIGPGGPKDVTPDLEAWAANLAKVPLYAFAGAKDKVVPAERSERMVKAIKAAGGTQAKLKIYPDEGHGAGRLAYASEELWEWMFGQQRG